MHKRARSLLNWRLFLFFFSKGGEGIKDLCFATLGFLKTRWPQDKLTLCGEDPMELQRESIWRFPEQGMFSFSAKALFQGENDMY